MLLHGKVLIPIWTWTMTHWFYTYSSKSAKTVNSFDNGPVLVEYMCLLECGTFPILVTTPVQCTCRTEAKWLHGPAFQKLPKVASV